ncbi:Brain protein 16 [Caligus rogercresseyi]|uniref:Protein HGH1 homolog n=1 Tax=Caligus rogercresseyi TaxID=217165 RepID=A0A7T8KJK2_CALRO|nr:Brain protein 16 [Caligus rogercresseyi]
MSEVLQFLDPSARLDVRVLAMNHILGMTGDAENRKLLLEMGSELCERLLALMSSKPGDNAGKVCAKDASLALINLSCESDFISLLLGDKLRVAPRLWALIQDSDSELADPAAMIASNLTIHPTNTLIYYNQLKSNQISLPSIISLFTKKTTIPTAPNFTTWLHFSSPYTEYKSSSVRRGGIIGTLRNLCFDETRHYFLLREVQILPRLLLPLAGPSPEDMDPEEMEALPLDLQYLGDEKEIEADPDIRKMLLESMTQLCATKEGREFMRSNNAYVILKEFHKTEKDKVVRLACENLVDIIIKKEEEIKVNNYKDVDVPEDIIPELKQMDEEYLQES